MILAAILLASDEPVATTDIYRECVPEILGYLEEELRDLGCQAITVGGYTTAKKRDAASGLQRLCVPPSVSLGDAANKVREWLRANPGRREHYHTLAADALTASYPCPPPEEPTP